MKHKLKIVNKHQILSLTLGIFLIGQFFKAGAQIKEKSGDWETLKMVNTKPTDIKDFATAFPIEYKSSKNKSFYTLYKKSKNSESNKLYRFKFIALTILHLSK